MKRFILFTVLMFSLAFAAHAEMSKGQTVYVPVYSHIYTGDRERPFLLTATVSIRNTDMSSPVTIISADYYDSDGQKIAEYAPKSVTLKPLTAVRFVIKESDKQGGSGASVIVRWTAKNSVSAPLIESVMIGAQNQQGISFTSRGKVILESK
ncbi:MAG: DUF3124 domain-containing protein [Deferribacterales bacterium]